MTASNEFDALLLEGIFSVEGPLPTRENFDQLRVKDIVVVDDAGVTTNVVEALQPFVGRDVQLSVHHWPPEPLQIDRWGGGCCFWQPYGWCPQAHHHEGEGHLVEMSGRGKLLWDDDWDDPNEECFCLGGLVIPLTLLVGHRSRIVLATVVDLEEMKARMGEHWTNPEDLDGTAEMHALDMQLEGLQGILDKLKDFQKVAGLDPMMTTADGGSSSDDDDEDEDEDGKE